MGGRLSGRSAPAANKLAVDEQELIRVAVFNLEQAAQRILALAGEVETESVDRHLRSLSHSITAHARKLQTHHAEPGPRRGKPD